MTVEEIIVWSVVPMLCGVITVQVVMLILTFPKLKLFPGDQLERLLIRAMIANANIVILLSMLLIAIIVMLYNMGFKISMI